jgi:Fe-S cluster biogenesis protein NfuA
MAFDSDASRGDVKMRESAPSAESNPWMPAKAVTFSLTSSTMARTINIHAVKVPNPLAMKFEVDGLLLTQGAYDFASPEEAPRSPLARKLFGLDYVGRVFIAKNFITVTKKDALPSWDSVLIDARILMKKHLEAGEPLFDFDGTMAETAPVEEDYLSGKIRETIDDQIQPATWQDGGEITFESFRDGVVSVRLAGACRGCPFAPRTIKHGVEVILKRHFPDVVSVTSSDVDWTDTQQEEAPPKP